MRQFVHFHNRDYFMMIINLLVEGQTDPFSVEVNEDIDLDSLYVVLSRHFGADLTHFTLRISDLPLEQGLPLLEQGLVNQCTIFAYLVASHAFATPQSSLDVEFEHLRCFFPDDDRELRNLTLDALQYITEAEFECIVCSLTSFSKRAQLRKLLKPERGNSEGSTPGIEFGHLTPPPPPLQPTETCNGTPTSGNSTPPVPVPVSANPAVSCTGHDAMYYIRLWLRVLKKPHHAEFDEVTQTVVFMAPGRLARRLHFESVDELRMLYVSFRLCGDSMTLFHHHCTKGTLKPLKTGATTPPSPLKSVYS